MRQGENVPPEAKQIILQRVAEGKSYSKALEGLPVNSKSTVHKYVQENSNEIERMRGEYLRKIEEKYGADMEERAQKWAEMARATKLFGKDGIEIPDWRSRVKALKYIDALAGLAPVKGNGKSTVDMAVLIRRKREQYGW